MLTKLGEDLGTVRKSALQQPVKDFVQMEHVCKVQLVESLKHLKTNFYFEVVKVPNEMKKASEDCNVGAYRQIVHCVAMLSTRLADVRRIDVSATSALDTSPNGKSVRVR